MSAGIQIVLFVVATFMTLTLGIFGISAGFQENDRATDCACRLRKLLRLLGNRRILWI